MDAHAWSCVEDVNIVFSNQFLMLVLLEIKLNLKDSCTWTHFFVYHNSGLRKANMRALRTQRVDRLEPGGLQSTGRPVMLRACWTVVWWTQSHRVVLAMSRCDCELRVWARTSFPTAADPVKSNQNAACLCPNQTKPFHQHSPPPRSTKVVFGVWSLVSVYSAESLASWCVTCDVLRRGLPLWDPRGRVMEDQQPPSPGGPQRPQQAHGRWSLQRSPVSLLWAKKRWSERWRWDWPRPPSQMPGERLRLWRGPAGRVLGRNRCNLSPSIPSVSTSVVEPRALSSCPRSFSFTRSRGVVGLHPTPPSTQQQIQTPKN